MEILNLNIYQQLLTAVEKLPKEAVERAKKEITRKGYDTTGYQYQFLVNILNETLGLGKWGFSYTILKESEKTWRSGQNYWEITVNVNVWIKDQEEKISFDCVGGHKSEMHADALKGAITNGFKKTVAFFGVGKKAYEGTIDDDYRPIPQDNTKLNSLVENVRTGQSIPIIEYQETLDSDPFAGMAINEAKKEWKRSPAYKSKIEYRK